MKITQLGRCLDDDYPEINWTRHSAVEDLWLEIDERHKAGQPVSDLLSGVAYRLRLSRRWPRVDCLAMVPGLAISDRARAAFEALEVPGMRFLEFRVNGAPFFLFYTDRCVDCLDLERSDIEYYRSSPRRVMEVVGYVFRTEQLRKCDVFTTPELSNGMFFWVQQTFVIETARAAIEAAGLIGFRFQSLPGPNDGSNPA